MKKVKRISVKGEKEYLPGYPESPENEDIYNKDEEETELNPENPVKHKKKSTKYLKSNEKDFEDVETGSDLDVPGSSRDEDDDDFFDDEENDYYSLGGDSHDDLEEDWN